MQYQKCFDAIRNNYDPTDLYIGGGVSQKAVKEYHVMAEQTTTEIQKLSVPWLAIQGSLDRNIDPKVIVKLGELAKNTNAEARCIDGVGHSLVNGLHPPNPPSIDKNILEIIRSFLRDVRRSSDF